MNDPAASSGVSSSLLGRHSVLDAACPVFDTGESSRVFWIPAFAGMTNSPQAAGNTTRRDLRIDRPRYRTSGLPLDLGTPAGYWGSEGILRYDRIYLLKNFNVRGVSLFLKPSR